MSNDSAVKILFDDEDRIHLTGGLNGGALVVDVGEALMMAYTITKVFTAPMGAVDVERLRDGGLDG